MEKITSPNELKHQKPKEYFVALNGGFKSSKTISYSNNKFHIVNEIDGSTESLTEKQLMDNKHTAIGEAISKGAFYKY